MSPFSISSSVLLRRRSPRLIHRIVTSQLISTRPVSTQTNRHPPSPSSPPFFALRLFCGSTHDRYNEGSQSFFRRLLKYISSAVVVAVSGVGFCYWSFLCDRDSFVCCADSGSNSTETQTKPRFFFKDEYRRKVFFKYEKRIQTQSSPEKIDKEEFKKVMTMMRTHNRQGASHRYGLRHGHKVARSVENAGLLECFFGKDGKECLEHGKFVQFLRDWHDEAYVVAGVCPL